MARTAIFRSAAVERLSTPDRLDQAFKVTTPLGWVALGALFCLVAGAVVASILILVPVTVAGSGIILPAAGIMDVGFQSGGRITRIAVAPGQHVRRGEVVATLDQPELQQQVAALQSARGDLLNDRARISGFQSISGRERGQSDAEGRAGLAHSIELAQQRLGFYRERAALLSQLVAKKFALKQTLVDQQIEIGKAEEEINADRLKLQQIDAQSADSRISDQKEILNLDLRIADATRQLQDAQQHLAGAQAVISPYDGRVVELKHNPGELVQPGGSLLSLLPDDAPATTTVRRADGASLMLILYVPAIDGKKIQPGMVVEVSPTTVRPEEYGFMLGRVQTVATIPSTAEGMMRVLKNQQLVAALAAHGAPFQVTVSLDRDPHTPSGYRWSSSQGPDTEIGPGALATGAVRVRKLRPIEIAIPVLQRLFRQDR